jgi:hypothetical protein
MIKNEKIIKKIVIREEAIAAFYLQQFTFCPTKTD